MTAEERMEILALADDVAKRLRRDMFAAAALQGLCAKLGCVETDEDARGRIDAAMSLADLLARRLEEVQF